MQSPSDLSFRTKSDLDRHKSRANHWTGEEFREQRGLLGPDRNGTGTGMGMGTGTGMEEEEGKGEELEEKTKVEKLEEKTKEEGGDEGEKMKEEGKEKEKMKEEEEETKKEDETKEVGNEDNREETGNEEDRKDDKPGSDRDGTERKRRRVPGDDDEKDVGRGLKRTKQEHKEHMPLECLDKWERLDAQVARAMGDYCLVTKESKRKGYDVEDGKEVVQAKGDRGGERCKAKGWRWDSTR